MRYRSPTTIQEWFEEYEVHKPEELHASFAVFLRVYNESWKNRLRIRKVSVHSTCHQCAVWREYRKLARVPKDFEAITAAHQAHVKAVFLDRGIEERLAALGEAATAAGARVSKAVSILDMSGDGADQAKFRLPRNFTMTKLWESCWRPQLHVIGNLASGVLEAFYMTDVDLPKDANLAVTCWARSLHRCSEILQQREQEMPEHVRFHTDNAASEGKNLTVFAFAAYLVWCDAFQSADCTQFIVGHTHNRQDQRIGVALSVPRKRPGSFFYSFRRGAPWGSKTVKNDNNCVTVDRNDQTTTTKTV